MTVPVQIPKKMNERKKNLPFAILFKLSYQPDSASFCFNELEILNQFVNTFIDELFLELKKMRILTGHIHLILLVFLGS